MIERRFGRGLKNLHDIYLPIVSDWLIIDNSSENTTFVAEKRADKFVIHNTPLWEEINSYE